MQKCDQSLSNRQGLGTIGQARHKPPAAQGVGQSYTASLPFYILDTEQNICTNLLKEVHTHAALTSVYLPRCRDLIVSSEQGEQRRRMMAQHHSLATKGG